MDMATVGPLIEQGAREIVIQVDAAGVISGSTSAVNSARRQLNALLDGYEGCNAGVVLTYGTNQDIGGGQQLARATNVLLRQYFPEIFGEAAFTDLADLTEEQGTVTITVYFFKGCVPSG